MIFSQTISLKKSKSKILAVCALILVFCIFMAGFFLNIALEEHFFFASTIPIASTSFWVFLALVPCFTVLLLKANFDKQHSDYYPTWWVRRLIMFPLFVLFPAVLVATAPLGWLITYTWLGEHPNTQVSARIITTEKYGQKTRSCDQQGEVVVGARQIRICFEGLIDLPVKHKGDIKLLGKQSSFGFMIERIQYNETE
ncbi:hypothetical protein H8K33_05875 [Undibacterium amnicola]|uniref:Uncharacterized protein n=2 Tax=Undibacterium amnicola TaxID=1834038 RepID=A0ABR6XNE0_9BURK|nr:hypothetical protein [Undibacterium amnicola]